MIACERDNLPVVRTLLDRNANPLYKNDLGKLAIFNIQSRFFILKIDTLRVPKLALVSTEELFKSHGISHWDQCSSLMYFTTTVSHHSCKLKEYWTPTGIEGVSSTKYLNHL